MKILAIDSCYDCKHWKISHRGVACAIKPDSLNDETMEKINWEFEVPDWCPLPDGDYVVSEDDKADLLIKLLGSKLQCPPNCENLFVELTKKVQSMFTPIQEQK